MNQSVSWNSQQVHLYFFLNLYSNTAVIVLSEDVVCVSLRVCSIVCTLKNATVCSICSCLTCLAPYPRKWIISRPVSSQGGLCEPLFWHRFINQTSFPFFFFPSFLPSHTSTPWASRLIYLLDIWHDLSQRKSKQVLTKYQILEINLALLFSFQLGISWLFLKGT